MLLGVGTLNAARLAVVWVLAGWCDERIVGAFHLAGTLAAPLVLLFSLELRAAFLADVAGRFSFADYRAARQVAMLGAAATLAAIIFAIAGRSPADPLLWFMLATALLRVVQQLGDIEWGWFQRHERIDLLATSAALRGVALLLPFLVLPLLFPRPLTHDDPLFAWLPAVLAAALAGSLAIWRGYDLPWIKRLGAPLHGRSRAALLGVLRRGLPLGIVIALVHLADAAPTWIVWRSAGLEPLAQVGVLKYLAMTAGFIVLQMGVSAGNQLATRYHADPRGFARLAIVLCLLAVGVGALMLALTWLLGGPILRTFFTAAYARHESELLVLMAAEAIVLPGVIFGVVLTHVGRFWIQAPLQIAIVAITVLCGLAWIPADPIGGYAASGVARATAQTGLYGLCVLALIIGARRRAKDASGPEGGA